MALSIDVSENAGVVLLRLRGKLIFGKEGEVFQIQMDHLLVARKAKIVLNMEKISHIDDSLGAVVAALTSARKQGGGLKIVNPSKSVQELLALTRLNTIFEVFSTEEEALASFK